MKAQTTKIILLTDIHICAPGETIIGLDPSAQLKLVLEHAVAHHSDAAAIVIMGDLTHNGTVAEYHALKPVIDEVAIPVVPMLGNHDRREAFQTVFPDAPQSEGGFVQSVVDLDAGCVITLDSLDGPPYDDDHHAGRLCPDRLAFLDRALSQRDDAFALVCVHHPPFATGLPAMDAIPLQDGAAFLDRLHQAGRVHLMCGHVHRTISGSSRGVPWTMLKSTCHQGVLDFVDANAHLSSNDPAGYGLALLSPQGVVVHHINVGLTDVQVFDGYDQVPR